MSDEMQNIADNEKGPGRPTKYDKIKGLLDVVRELAVNGYSNQEIADAIGIARSTLQEYLNEHQEFSDALKGGKILADNKVASAVFKRATGYDYVEEHIEYAPGSTKKNEDGTEKEKPAKVKSVKKVKKHVPANVQAAFLWLYNRRRHEWKQRQIELPPDTPTIPEFENWSNDELKDFIREARRNPDEE